MGLITRIRTWIRGGDIEAIMRLKLKADKSLREARRLEGGRLNTDARFER